MLRAGAFTSAPPSARATPGGGLFHRVARPAGAPENRYQRKDEPPAELPPSPYLPLSPLPFGPRECVQEFWPRPAIRYGERAVRLSLGPLPLAPGSRQS